MISRRARNCATMASGLAVKGAGVGSTAGCALGVVLTSVVFIVSLPYPGSVNRPRQGSRLDTGRAAVLPGTNPRPAGHRRHAEGPESMKSRECAPRAWLWGRILTRVVAILLRLFWTEKSSLHPSPVSTPGQYQLVQAVLSGY